MPAPKWPRLNRPHCPVFDALSDPLPHSWMETSPSPRPEGWRIEVAAGVQNGARWRESDRVSSRGRLEASGIRIELRRVEPMTMFTVNELSKTAAEISGVYGSALRDAPKLAALKDTMLRYPVVAIRNQTLSAKQQAAFSRQLGSLEQQDRKTYCHPDDPDILILSNEIKPDGTAVGIVDAGDSSAFRLLTPPRALQEHHSVRGAQSARRRRYRVLQHVSGLRCPAGRHEAPHRRPLRASPHQQADQSARHRFDRPHRCEGLLQEARKSDQAGVTADGTDPSRDRPAGALCVAALHHRHRRYVRRGSAATARPLFAICWSRVSVTETIGATAIS